MPLEIKVVCDCGQKYKFDVEPVNGLMPFAVRCPICGVDGTQKANVLLAQALAHRPPAPVFAPAPRAVPVAPVAAPAAPPLKTGIRSYP